MDVMTFFLLTLPSGWCMPAEWSQWSVVASHDGNGGDIEVSGSLGDGGDIEVSGSLGDGGDIVVSGSLGDGGDIVVSGSLGGATWAGGATLATLAGIAAISGLIKAGIITTGMVASGLFGVGSWLKDHDFEEGVLLQNGRLDKGEELTPKNGKFKLLMQDDGNLVISHEDGTDVWSTKANGFKANVIKPFGLGLEPLGNMKHTSQLMNSGEMKSEVLRENRLRVLHAWSVWSEFTACSGTCGPATKMRERTCTDSANPEITCEGPTAQIYNCRLPSCAEAGGWSAWSDVNACSATCGSATKTRKRTCNDLNGGLTCLGSSQETIDCNLGDCREARDILVIDGGWSAWNDLTTCSASCGRATKMRVRTCSDPEPMNGGLMCQGLTEVIEDCNLDDCLVIRGGWSAWSDLGACTATCGSATKKMARTCTNPEPSDESLTCQGSKVIIMDCGLPDCPIDGGWSKWSDFSSCTASCGSATKRRERKCGNPVPANGGLDCSGLSKETLNCDLPNCAIFG